MLNFSSRSLVSYVSYYFGWWIAALGPRYQMEWIGPAALPFFVGIHIAFMPKNLRLSEAVFLSALALTGFTLDTVLMGLGLFETNPKSVFTPAWLVSMWVLLGLTFESMLVMRRSLYFVCLMGAVSGPLTYLFAQAVNIMTYREPQWLSMTIHAVFWAALMPLLFTLRDQVLQRVIHWTPPAD